MWISPRTDGLCVPAAAHLYAHDDNLTLPNGGCTSQKMLLRHLFHEI